MMGPNVKVTWANLIGQINTHVNFIITAISYLSQLSDGSKTEGNMHITFSFRAINDAAYCTVKFRYFCFACDWSMYLDRKNDHDCTIIQNCLNDYIFMFRYCFIHLSRLDIVILTTISTLFQDKHGHSFYL